MEPRFQLEFNTRNIKVLSPQEVGRKCVTVMVTVAVIASAREVRCFLGASLNTACSSFFSSGRMRGIWYQAQVCVQFQARAIGFILPLAKKRTN